MKNDMVIALWMLNVGDMTSFDTECIELVKYVLLGELV